MQLFWAMKGRAGFTGQVSIGTSRSFMFANMFSRGGFHWVAVSFKEYRRLKKAGDVYNWDLDRKLMAEAYDKCAKLGIPPPR